MTQLSTPTPTSPSTPSTSTALVGGWHVLPPLPYGAEALAPVISARTLACHHGAHHKGYVDTLNRLAAGTLYAEMPLPAIIAATVHVPASAAIYHNAAQAWSHAFYWRCMNPATDARVVPDALRGAMQSAFGGTAECTAGLAAAAAAHFGSGWLWLVQSTGEHAADVDAEAPSMLPHVPEAGVDVTKAPVRHLEVLTTQDADVPMSLGKRPLLCVDLWEHAYYLDYQSARAKHVDAVLARLVDWPAVATRLA